MPPRQRFYATKTLSGPHQLPVGAVAKSAFHIGPATLDASGRIVYNAVKGTPSCDDDGTGSHQAHKFAKLDPGLALTEADFLTV
jgi:hypothetical protein